MANALSTLLGTPAPYLPPPTCELARAMSAAARWPAAASLPARRLSRASHAAAPLTPLFCADTNVVEPGVSYTFQGRSEAVNGPNRYAYWSLTQQGITLDQCRDR